MQRPQRWRPLAAVVTIAACIGAWWLWPSWTGADARLDVAVFSDPAMAAGANTILAALHGDGRTADYVPPIADWCAAAPVVADTIARRSPGVVVLSFATLGSCGPSAVTAAVSAAGGRHVVIVDQPGDAAAVIGAGVAGARVLNPARLVGGAAEPAEMPCQWWDDCPPSGLVATRDSGGRLTDAGFSRVARMLVPVA